MTGNAKNVAEMEEAAALMRDAGLTVLASSGWKDRGRSSELYPWALIDHHTAATDDITSMLINGRSDLPGPLCNFELREYGDWNLIASGRANHAGEASVSNSESYGIEATGPQGYPDTYGPAAFPHNYESYEIGVACILAAMGAEVGDTMGHKEIAPTRKIDPYFDMGSFRSGVAAGGDLDMGLSSEDKTWLDKEFDRIYTQMSDVNKAITRGEINGAIDKTGQHYKDSNRATYEKTASYGPLARGEMDYGLVPGSQHFQDSHRGIFQLVSALAQALGVEASQLAQILEERFGWEPQADEMAAKASREHSQDELA